MKAPASVRVRSPSGAACWPKRLSLDENLRAKEGEKEKKSFSFPWSLALRNHSLAFRAHLCEKRESEAPGSLWGISWEATREGELVRWLDKSYTRFLCFPGCSLTRAWSVVRNVHFKLCYEAVLSLWMDHCSPQFLISFHSVSRWLFFVLSKVKKPKK